MTHVTLTSIGKYRDYKAESSVDVGEEIANALWNSEISSIVSLDLSDYNWWSQRSNLTYSKLAEFIFTQQSLEELIITSSSFSSDICQAIMFNLVNSPVFGTIKTLDLSNSWNFDGDEICQHLADFIATAPKLEKI